MFPHNNHNQFISHTPPPPHFAASALADGGPNGRGGGMGNALGMGVGGGGLGNIAPVPGMGGIDWAQLAQQWIHMRDTVPPPAAPAPPNFGMIPMAPPPPIISNAPAYQRHLPPVNYEEHGEADMDMDDDTERAHSIEMQMSTPPPVPLPPSAAVPQITQSANHIGFGRPKQQQWTNWPGQSNKPATSSPTSHIPSLLKLNVSNPNEPHVIPHQHPPSQHQQQLPHPQQQQQPHHHHQQQQHHQLQQQPQQSPHQQHMDESGGGNTSEIDNNKRKMLPAWIREGLEKMEREKQRQLERQQPSTPTATSLNLNLLESSTDHHEHPNVLVQQGHNVKQVSSKTLTTPVNLMNLTNVPSDSEDSNEEFSEDATSGHLKGKDMLIRRRRSDSRSSPNELKPDSDNVEKPGQKQQDNENRNDATARARQAHDNGKNYEERLADLMLVVRRTLTEILLETTNEEIAAIANETIKAHRAKASSAQVIRKSALSSITGNLGLAAYGDSSSESDGNDEDDDDKDSDANEIGYGNADSSKETSKNVHQLSAEELKSRIRRSKRSFEKVINDIEHRVTQQEQRDELELEKQRKLEMERKAKRRESSDQLRQRSLTNPQSIGETVNLGSSSNAKLKQFNGKRPSRKERTTRFSDNKDGKQSNQSFVQHVVAASAVAPASLPTTSTNTPTLMPSKIKAVPNVATNLLQMPESVATMLNAADKALQKVNKSTRKPKSKRRHSSTSSSSSSSSGSSRSSTSSSSSSSNSSTSGTTKSSSSRSINSKKKSSTNSHRTASNSHSSRHHRNEESTSSRSRSRNKYDRREHDREREHRHQYSNNSNSGQHRRRPYQRDSSHSGDDPRDRQRLSRRGGGGNDYGKKRHRTRSRSRSRSRTSQHHHHSVSHSSSSSASHHRKRV